MAFKLTQPENAPLPSSVTEAGTVTSVNLERVNVVSPNVSRPSGSAREQSEKVFANALSPIFLRRLPFSKVISSIDIHSSNAFAPISISDAGKSTRIRLTFCEKAPCPIDTSAASSANLSVLRLSASVKAKSSMVRMFLPTVT